MSHTYQVNQKENKKDFSILHISLPGYHMKHIGQGMLNSKVALNISRLASQERFADSEELPSCSPLSILADIAGPNLPGFYLSFSTLKFVVKKLVSG